MSDAIFNTSGPVAINTSRPVKQQFLANSDIFGRSFEGAHSDFNQVRVDLRPDFFEEVSIALSSLRKFETKDDKKYEDLKKALERLKQTVPDIPGIEKIDKLLQQILDAKKRGGLTESQIRELAQEYSGDPSHQYLAMAALVEYLQGTDESGQKTAVVLKVYNSRFYDDFKKDIQSGLNVSLIAADYAKSNGYQSIQELRDIWRQGLEVPDFQHPLEAYQFAKDKCGYEQIDKGIGWFMKALSAEMQAMKTSVDANHLKHVRSRLEVIYGLQTVIAFSKSNENAVVRLRRQNQDDPLIMELLLESNGTVKQGVLVEEVLQLLNQRWISADDVDSIPEKIGVTEQELNISIFLLNQIRETYKKIPEQYFKESEHRDNILEATQEALDKHVVKEEKVGEFDDDFDISFEV